MAKYEFWARLGNSSVVSELVEIPDEQTTGKSENDINCIILGYHIKWSEHLITGDWKKVE